jgi:hypothetical protein
MPPNPTTPAKKFSFGTNNQNQSSDSSQPSSNQGFFGQNPIPQNSQSTNSEQDTSTNFNQSQPQYQQNPASQNSFAQNTDKNPFSSDFNHTYQDYSNLNQPSNQPSSDSFSESNFNQQEVSQNAVSHDQNFQTVPNYETNKDFYNQNQFQNHPQSIENNNFDQTNLSNQASHTDLNSTSQDSALAWQQKYPAYQNATGLNNIPAQTLQNSNNNSTEVQETQSIQSSNTSNYPAKPIQASQNPYKETVIKPTSENNKNNYLGSSFAKAQEDSNLQVSDDKKSDKNDNKNTKNDSSKKNKASLISIISLVLIGLLMVGTIAGGYYLYQEVQVLKDNQGLDENADALQTIEDLERENIDQQAEVQDLKESLDEINSQLEAVLQEQNRQLEGNDLNSSLYEIDAEIIKGIDETTLEVDALLQEENKETGIFKELNNLKEGLQLLKNSSDQNNFNTNLTSLDNKIKTIKTLIDSGEEETVTTPAQILELEKKFKTISGGGSEA